MQKYTLETGREGLYDITVSVCEAIRDSGVEDGLCVVFCPHTTAGITLNENADPDVKRDFILGIDEAFPDRAEFKHREGNSHAHLKSSHIGASETIIIEKGRPVFGTWQGVYFCEFDGPRHRQYFVKVIGK